MSKITLKNNIIKNPELNRTKNQFVVRIFLNYYNTYFERPPVLIDYAIAGFPGELEVTYLCQNNTRA